MSLDGQPLGPFKGPKDAPGAHVLIEKRERLCNMIQEKPLK